MPNKTIWMNPPLEKLAAECREEGGRGRGGMFSRRLGDIVERYDAIMKNTTTPELTVDEKMILGVVFGGGNVSPLSIRYLGDSIIDTRAAPLEQLKAFAEKANRWTASEKVAAVESLNL